MPPTGSDAYRAVRFEREFEKQGGGTDRTRLFRGFTESIQQFLAEQTTLQLAEIPIAGYFENQDTWLLATSRRVLWSRPGFRHELKYSAIKRMGWSSGPDGAADRQRPDEWDMYIETDSGKQLTKHYSPWLFFCDKDSRRYEVLLERAGMLAIWNSMSLMVRLEEIHPRNGWLA